jgi:hypothetical protein
MPRPHLKPEPKKKVVRSFDESVAELTKDRLFTKKQQDGDSSAGRNVHSRMRKKL